MTELKDSLGIAEEMKTDIIDELNSMIVRLEGLEMFLSILGTGTDTLDYCGMFSLMEDAISHLKDRVDHVKEQIEEAM